MPVVAGVPMAGTRFAVRARQHRVDDEARQRLGFVERFVGGQNVGRVRANDDQALIRLMFEALVQAREPRFASTKPRRSALG